MLVGAVLGPERREEPELGVGRLAAEAARDPVVFFGGEARVPREVERDLRWCLRQPRLPLEEAAILDEAPEEGLEQQESVRAAHRRLRRTLGVRHKPQHGALRVHDAGDVLERSVREHRDRKSTRLNSSHGYISYAVFCLKKKKKVP